MSITEAAYAIHLYPRPPSPPVLREPSIYAEALRRGQQLPVDRWAACLRCVVEAG